jgi:putative hydroxymethylpyrimidine transport system substrate-binding protein
VAALASGRADAAFGGSWNVEGEELQARGLEPVVTRVQSLGVPAYDELVIVAGEDPSAADAKAIRDFLAAVTRGTEAAIADRQAAADLVAARGGDPNPAAIRDEVEATLPMLSRSGEISRDQAEGLARWMYEEGLTEREVPASELVTDAYLEPSS